MLDWHTFIKNFDERWRRASMLHELFHRVQPALKLLTNNGRNDHLDTLEGRCWLQLEWRALGASGTARRDAVGDALTFRQMRRSLFPGSTSNENVDEIREGLAEYTGAETSTVSFIRDFHYRSGVAYGLLLDDASPGWPRRITASDDLG